MPASQGIHMNTISQLLCKAGQGILQAVVINTRGAAGNRLTLYDSLVASGEILAIIDTVNAQIGRIGYDIQVKTGVYAVLDTGTPADVMICTD